MENLFELACLATNKETMASPGGIMRDLETRQRQAEAMLYDHEEDEEELIELEAEIVRFETWAEQVRPLLVDQIYLPTYEEQRLAVRIVGIKATVFPLVGDWPFRYKIDITIPKIIEKMKGCITNDQR